LPAIAMCNYRLEFFLGVLAGRFHKEQLCMSCQQIRAIIPQSPCCSERVVGRERC